MTTNPTIDNNNQNGMGASVMAPPSVQAVDAPVSETAVSEFADSGGVHVGGGTLAPELDYITPADESLEKYFSRPVVVFTSAWASTAFSSVTFDPWSLFMSNAYVKNKYTNYSMFRAKLHLRATFNGTPLQAGALQLSYGPGPASAANNSFVCIPANWTVYRGSQLRCIEIYGSGSTSGEIEAPFFFHKPYAGITQNDTDISMLGRARIQQLVPLNSSVNAAVVPGTVQVYAWLTDVELRVATWVNAMHRSPVAATEAKPDFNISRPATVAAKAASMMSGLPLIGPYATAASVVARGVASVAAAFGFARPFDLRDKMLMIPRFMGGMALTEGVDSPEKLSCDPKQGVSMGAAWAGLPSEPDPLSIASIAARESLFSIDTNSWTTSTAVGTNLAVFAVYPHTFNKFISGSTYEICPLSYAAAPFRYWTGSIIVRIKAIAGGMSRGRLLIWHYPHNDAGYATATYTQIVNTCQTCILDLSAETDVEFTVRPSMTKPWMNLGLLTSTAVDPVQGEPRGNGQIIVTVINALSAPLASSVGLLYYARGGPDFQVAVPTLSNIQNWAWQNAMFRPGAEQMGVPPSGPGGTANPNTSCELTGRPQREAPVEPFFGERIESLRSLAKRFCFYAYRYPIPPAGGASVNQVAITIDDDFYGSLNQQVLTGSMTPWTWLLYAGMPFLALRGGVRYRAIMNAIPGQTDATPGARLGWERCSAAGRIGKVWTTTPGNSLFGTGLPAAKGPWSAMITSGDGQSYTPQQRQPVAECEFPYYSNDLFTFLGSSNTPNNKHPDGVRMWAVYGTVGSTQLPPVSFDVFQAAADDFSAMEWCGVGQVIADPTKYPAGSALLNSF